MAVHLLDAKVSFNVQHGCLYESDDPHMIDHSSSRAGMSSPRLTIATVIDGLPANYRKSVRINRLQFAHNHGYR